MTEEHPLFKYLRKEALPTAFCSDCGCGTILNVFIHAIDELGLSPKEIAMVTGIGCSSWIPSPYLLADTLHTTHGRAIAFATGVKIMKPDMKVVVIAGDGDIAAIGGNHLIHAARRNIGILTILVNNSIYGMTGGQVAPTTPLGDSTTTTPYGNTELSFDICELMSAVGATYVARWTTLHVRRLKKSIEKALMKKGFSFIEVLSQCPTSYGRRIGKRKGIDFLKEYKNLLMPTEEGKEITIGEIVDKEREEFTERLRSSRK